MPVPRIACRSPTNNASDYRRLYAAEPLHVGVVILIPNVGRRLQQRLFRGALGGAPASTAPRRYPSVWRHGLTTGTRALVNSAVSRVTAVRP